MGRRSDVKPVPSEHFCCRIRPVLAILPEAADRICEDSVEVPPSTLARRRSDGLTANGDSAALRTRPIPSRVDVVICCSLLCWSLKSRRMKAGPCFPPGRTRQNGATVPTSSAGQGSSPAAGLDRDQAGSRDRRAAANSPSWCNLRGGRSRGLKPLRGRCRHMIAGRQDLKADQKPFRRSRSG
jgi:hypothetical protein